MNLADPVNAVAADALFAPGRRAACGGAVALISMLIQLSLGIVIGHVVGVVVAHDLSVRWLPARQRISGQLALLAVMVVFTCGGLLLLFAG